MSKRLASDRKKLEKSRSQGQTGRRKQFSQSLHDTHDIPARAAVIAHLDSIGIWARENDDIYGPDLVVWKGFRPVGYIEIEQRSKWTKGPWPESWDPVNIPERKLHLFKLGLKCELWVVSRDLRHVLVIEDHVVTSLGRLEEFSNSQITIGELFMRVPLSSCNRVELTHENA